MRKSALCLIIALAVGWTTIFQAQYAYADEDGDYTYIIDGGTATITDYPRGAPVDVIIPDTLGGVPVSGIGETAFYITDLTSVTFPDSLTSIGDAAFGYNYLTSVEIPNGVTYIGMRAFANNQLTSVVIPDSVTTMEQEAFRDNQLASVVLSKSLTSISDFAFRGNLLTKIVIPASVTSIGGYSFRYNSLSSVVVLNRSTAIDPLSFNNNQAVPANLKIFGFAGSPVQTYAIGKGFTFVDGSSLFGALATAKQLLEHYAPGTAIGEVPAGIYDDLAVALSDAEQFIDAITNASAASDLAAAAAELNAVIQSFNGAIVEAGDAADLVSLLADAAQMLTDHPVGANVGETTVAARDAFQAAIEAAHLIADDAENYTQLQLDTAVADLNEAIAIFEAAWVELVLEAPTAGVYGIHDSLRFTVSYGYGVTVTGTPTIPITIGNHGTTVVVQAAYTGTRDTALTELTFEYEVPEGFLDEDGIAIAAQINVPSGAGITRAGGVAASLAYASVDVSGIRVVSIAPTITLVSGGVVGNKVGVTVTADVQGTATGNALSKLAWMKGSHGTTGFAGGAGTDILTVGQFQVSANGIYTVYAKDAAGNEAVKEISVTGIQTPSPGSGGSGSGNPDIEIPATAIILVNGIQTEVSVTTEITSDKQSVIKLSLKPEQLAQSFESGRTNMVITVNGIGSSVQVNLPVPTLLRLLKERPDARVQVTVNGNSLDIPLAAIEQLSAITTFSLSVAEASNTANDALQSAVDMRGATALLDRPLVFALEADGRIVDDWQSINAHKTIKLTAAVDPDKATVVWMGDDKKLHFAPAIFASDGTVTIHSPYEGMYTIIRLDRKFTDLLGHWAQVDIERLANKLIVDGRPNGLFDPNATITRAEFAALLVRALGLPETRPGEPFTDVDSVDWFAGAVGAAKQAGLIGGYEDGSFRPEANITREQMAVMIANALSFAGRSPQMDSAIPTFSDAADISIWAAEATRRLAGLGIIRGVTDTTFVPQANATRAQSAVMITRMLVYLQFINK